MGPTAKAQDTSRFTADAQAEEPYCGWSSEFPGIQGKKGHRTLMENSHFAPVPGAPGMKGHRVTPGQGYEPVTWCLQSHWLGELARNCLITGLHTEIHVFHVKLET